MGKRHARPHPTPGHMLTKQLLDTTPGRVVTLLQTKPLTVEELATQLGLTANAVRSQLTVMERRDLFSLGQVRARFSVARRTRRRARARNSSANDDRSRA